MYITACTDGDVEDRYVWYIYVLLVEGYTIFMYIIACTDGGVVDRPCRLYIRIIGAVLPEPGFTCTVLYAHMTMLLTDCGKVDLAVILNSQCAYYMRSGDIFSCSMCAGYISGGKDTCQVGKQSQPSNG